MLKILEASEMSPETKRERIDLELKASDQTRTLAQGKHRQSQAATSGDKQRLAMPRRPNDEAQK
jgi:hypothetical protein